jgi:large subunit ribosomal protein L9
MEIILKEDVAKLGYKGDVVKVRPGYAHNFLIPNGLAVVADKANRKISQENLRQAAHKIEKVKASAEQTATDLQNATIEISAKTGSSGKIFGSITTLQIAQALKEKGFDIDRRRISLVGEIKTPGTYEASIDLHKEVKAKINLVVVPEEAA